MVGSAKKAAVSEPVFGDIERAEIEAVSQKLLGVSPERVAFPGGKSRSAFIIDAGGRLHVFAKRGKRGDSNLEALLLNSLAASGHTPKLTGLAGSWVVQEFVEGERLPVVLDQTPVMEERERLVSQSLDALHVIHATAAANPSLNNLPVIGEDHDWIWDRTGAAARMAADLSIDEPAIDRFWICELLGGQRREFIKYDARPGNALIDGAQCWWFDWEDCGLGRAVEDLVFVLCDEWTPLDRYAEARLIARHLDQFCGGFSRDQAREYLMVFGLVHTTIRLRMALKYRLRDGKWWNRQKCLDADKVGNTETETSRLIDRGIRWAEGHSKLRPFIPWFNEVRAVLDIPMHPDDSNRGLAA